MWRLSHNLVTGSNSQTQIFTMSIPDQSIPIWSNFPFLINQCLWICWVDKQVYQLACTPIPRPSAAKTLPDLRWVWWWCETSGMGLSENRVPPNPIAYFHIIIFRAAAIWDYLRAYSTFNHTDFYPFSILFVSYIPLNPQSMYDFPTTSPKKRPKKRPWYIRLD